MEYKVNKIKEEAETTKAALEERKGMKPPMCSRLTMSVTSLLLQCDKTLFLCGVIEQQQMKIDKIEQLAENGLNT